MRILVNAIFPHGKFNELVRAGNAGKVLEKILEEQKPEAVYFTERRGHRAMTMIVEVADSSQVPSIAEPWFLNLEAEVRMRVVMTPEDLGRAGLDELGKKWGQPL